MSEKPWLKYYPSDWRGDPALRMCSLAARGLWIEMIGLMHESGTPGHLMLNGRAPTTTQLASLVGADAKTVGRLLGELEEAAVFSRTDNGVIFSRRMVRDHRKSLAGKEAIARRWGSNPPIDEDGSKPIVAPNRSPNSFDDRSVDRNPITHARARSRPRSQSPESKQPQLDGVGDTARDRKQMPRRSDHPSKWQGLVPDRSVYDDGVSHATAGGYSVSIAADAVCEAAKINDAHWRGDWTPLICWLREGYDLQDRILPVVRKVAARPNYEPPHSLRFFDAAIREQRSKER